MKCPKCGYLGFEPVERCRNCGYEFALAPPAALQELPLRSRTDQPAPLDERSLVDSAMGPGDLHAGGAEPQPEPLAANRPATAPDLPLFGGAGGVGARHPDDAPLITRPSPPRQPLAVRRSTPDTPRMRSAVPRTPNMELGFEPADRPAPPQAVRESPSDPDRAGPEDASVAARLSAVIMDLAILTAVDVAVVYLTLQICGITLEELAILPKAPLIVFLVLQNGSYLVAFTAGGQTLGKMAAGIKVVSAGADPLDFGRALLRQILWVALAVPAGLGLLTVLGRDRRGVHDRFAGTRVVRASL